MILIILLFFCKERLTARGALSLRYAQYCTWTEAVFIPQPAYPSRKSATSRVDGPTIRYMGRAWASFFEGPLRLFVRETFRVIVAQFSFCVFHNFPGEIMKDLT